jgi:3-hydroxyacyl-CoA dehydrogenase/enoyl-CoA hydratase/3-hydroxybutyryl-CoA epimerase
MESSLQIERAPDGVAIVRWKPGLDCHSFGPGLLALIEAGLEREIADATVTGIVLAGDDRVFFGELDLAWLSKAVAELDETPLLAFAQRAARLACRIERSQKPIACAIAGDAKGVSLELAMACHRRFAAEGAGHTVGFTDLRYGLPPLMGTGWRLQQQLGREAATKLLLGSQQLTRRAAQEARLIDELAPSSDYIRRACCWIVLAAAQRTQRPAEAAIAAAMGPAGAAVEAVLEEGTHEFIHVARGSVARDMVRTLGLSVASANRLAGRPQGPGTRSFSRVGVLGAGLMGGGIALVAARAGLEVVLVDVDKEAAERGIGALRTQDETGVAAGRLDAAQSRETLARIRPTGRYEDLEGVDIVLEAVFEDRKVKAEATRRGEAAAGPAALFGTNTSTLPISGLAEASARPGQFIGLHFFSPVPRMPLIEIIRGRLTSDETLAHAMDFARAIGKTPIVVNDSRGFYTTRVVMAYQAEAFDMLAQGADPDTVEAGGTASGMPVPPLALSDAVALDLIHQINLQAARDLGDVYCFSPGYAMVGRMVEREGRKGRKSGLGFYDYGADGTRRIWPGLREFAAGPSRLDMPVADARDRLLAAQALEVVRCLEEGVITDPSQADVGALLGWGFAPWTGGPLSWIDRMGASACVLRCDELAQRYSSERLRPPASLREIAVCRGSVYGAAWPSLTASAERTYTKRPLN